MNARECSVLAAAPPLPPGVSPSTAIAVVVAQAVELLCENDDFFWSVAQGNVDPCCFQVSVFSAAPIAPNSPLATPRNSSTTASSCSSRSRVKAARR